MLSIGPISSRPISTGPVEDAVAEPTTEYGATFSILSNSEYLDWATADYDTNLTTYYIIPEDAMTWMQSPYIYCFFKQDEQNTVVDSNQDQVVNSEGVEVVEDNSGCFMNAIWDWDIDLEPPKTSRAIDVYNWRDGHSVVVSKNKIRGRGKVLQVRWGSVEGKPFDLLGWAAWISKNGKY